MYSERSQEIKRKYQSPLRSEQTQATQQRVLDAAGPLFLQRGYAPVSMAMVAEAAGVSRDLLYKSFGSKAALLKRLYDVALAGDDAPEPIAERPLMTDLPALPAAERISRIAAVHRDLFGRVGPLLSMIIAGAGAGEPDLAELRSVVDHERLVGTRTLVGTFDVPDAEFDRVVDEVWLLIAPENWELLSRRRGWDDEAYEAWLDRSLTGVLLPGSARAGVRRPAASNRIGHRGRRSQ